MLSQSIKRTMSIISQKDSALEGQDMSDLLNSSKRKKEKGSPPKDQEPDSSDEERFERNFRKVSLFGKKTMK